MFTDVVVVATATLLTTFQGLVLTKIADVPSFFAKSSNGSLRQLSPPPSQQKHTLTRLIFFRGVPIYVVLLIRSPYKLTGTGTHLRLQSTTW